MSFEWTEYANILMEAMDAFVWCFISIKTLFYWFLFTKRWMALNRDPVLDVQGYGSVSIHD